MNAAEETTTVEDPKAAKLKELRKAIEEQNRKRDQLAAQRAKVHELDAMERELEEAKRRVDEEQLLADTEAKLGPEGRMFCKVSAPGGMILLKKPHHLRWRRFVDSGKSDSESVLDVVLEHLIHPDEAAFTAMVEDYVDTIRQCGNALARLHGTSAKEVLPGK